MKWIPSHCGIEGNEEADRLANEGTKEENIEIVPLTYSDAMLSIKNLLIKEWQAQYVSEMSRKKHIFLEIHPYVKLRPWFYGLRVSGMTVRVINRM